MLSPKGYGGECFEYAMKLSADKEQHLRTTYAELKEEEKPAFIDYLFSMLSDYEDLVKTYGIIEYSEVYSWKQSLEDGWLSQDRMVELIIQDISNYEMAVIRIRQAVEYCKDMKNYRH